MQRRLLLELVGFTGLVLAAVLALLVAGQMARVGDLLMAAGPDAPWGEALGRGALILLEAALPLAGLLAAGLAYGRLRAEDAWLAHAALGRRPEPALLPALAVGLALGGGAAALAHGPVPVAVDGLRALLLDAASAALTVVDRPLALPGGGVALRRSDAVWIAVGDGADATLIRAADAHLAVSGDGASITLEDARLWHPDTRLQVGAARLTAPAATLERRLGMLGPPNALTTAALDGGDVHHRFTAHRRSALPAMAPLWALLGALLGARFGGPAAVALGAGSVAAAYWLLRTGELSARAGFMSPALAAWAPAALLGLCLAWIWHRHPALIASCSTPKRPCRRGSPSGGAPGPAHAPRSTPR